MIERVFIDASYTLASGKNSGIERVVSSIIRESSLLSHGGELPQPQLTITQSGRFLAVNANHLAAMRGPAKLRADVVHKMPGGYRVLADFICRVGRHRKLRKWLLPQPGHLGIFKLPTSIFQASVRRQIARTTQPLEFRHGDLLLLPDAYWVNRLRSSVWTAAARARRQGAAVATILYDLIPLTHPEFVGEKRRVAFLDYLKKAAANSDLLITISKTVRDQVAATLPTLQDPGQTFCNKICSFELGAELGIESSTAGSTEVDRVDSGTTPPTGAVRQNVLRLFDREHTPYLMVATFDPRKNHKYVLDAFELLWRDHPRIELCLVGRVGSRCEDVLQRIAAHKELGKRLHLFNDLSDAELQHCYDRARGVIFPSIVEGFGLPIVESLYFQRKTFASDTPIHREVGRDDCSYFDLASPNSLVDQVLSWEAVQASGKMLLTSTRIPTSWRSSTMQLFEQCMSQLDDRFSASNKHRAA